MKELLDQTKFCPKCKSKDIEIESWAMITVSHSCRCRECNYKWRVDDDY